MYSVSVMLMLMLLMLLAPSRAVPVSTNQEPATAADDQTWSPLTVAQCRATCLREFSTSLTKGSSCMQDAECFMCWQNCELLHSNWSVWGAMCSEKTICSPGCRHACLFLLSPPPSQSSLPLSATRSLAQLLVSGSQLRWPPLPEKSHVVYVLMWSGEEGNSNNWRQLQQTADLGAQLPTSPGAVRVLVVDPGGLLAVYTPVDSPLNVVPSWDDASNKQGLQSGGQSDWFTDDDQTATSGWSVRVGSVLHQGLLVVTELSWRPPASDLEAVNQKGDGSALYLVTWEVDGGGVSGNLYTDDTCVTLSLWPDTVFHIEVQLEKGSAAVSRSSPLLLDTSSLRPTLLPSASGSALSRLMLCWLVAAAELVMLFLAIRYCWRRRQRQHQEQDKKVLVHEEEPPHVEPELRPDGNQLQKDKEQEGSVRV